MLPIFQFVSTKPLSIGMVGKYFLTLYQLRSENTFYVYSKSVSIELAFILKTTC
jgi:hypothetical protein